MNKNIRDTDPEWGYRDHIREACPLLGDDFHKFMIVEMLPGAVIKPHKHAHHAVLYYPELAEPVYVTPQPGTMLYLPPGTVHQVPRVQRRRISIAMLIDHKESE